MISLTYRFTNGKTYSNGEYCFAHLLDDVDSWFWGSPFYYIDSVEQIDEIVYEVSLDGTINDIPEEQSEEMKYEYGPLKVDEYGTEYLLCLKESRWAKHFEWNDYTVQLHIDPNDLDYTQVLFLGSLLRVSNEARTRFQLASHWPSVRDKEWSAEEKIAILHSLGSRYCAHMTFDCPDYLFGLFNHWDDFDSLISRAHDWNDTVHQRIVDNNVQFFWSKRSDPKELYQMYSNKTKSSFN